MERGDRWRGKLPHRPKSPWQRLRESRSNHGIVKLALRTADCRASQASESERENERKKWPFVQVRRRRRLFSSQLFFCQLHFAPSPFQGLQMCNMRFNGSYSVVQKKNSCLFTFPAYLPPTNLGQPMHSLSALTEHVSMNLAMFFSFDPVSPVHSSLHSFEMLSDTAFQQQHPG